MKSVFISYRRADTQGWAGRLSADIATTFGAVARFFDLASIAPGADFRLEIERSLHDAAAVLVLSIGEITGVDLGPLEKRK